MGTKRVKRKKKKVRRVRQSRSPRGVGGVEAEAVQRQEEEEEVEAEGEAFERHAVQAVTVRLSDARTLQLPRRNVVSASPMTLESSPPQNS